MTNKNTNPIVITSASCTLSVIFSTPVEVLDMLLGDVNASVHLILNDLDGNSITRLWAEAPSRVIEDPRVFANGCVIGSASTGTGSTTASTCMEFGSLYVWLR